MASSRAAPLPCARWEYTATSKGRRALEPGKEKVGELVGELLETTV
jgi:hypothetical protein